MPDICSSMRDNICSIANRSLLGDSARQFEDFALPASQIGAKWISRPPNRLKHLILRDNLRLLFWPASQIGAKCISRPSNRLICLVLRDNLRLLRRQPRKLEQNAYLDYQIGLIAYFFINLLGQFLFFSQKAPHFDENWAI